MKIFNADFDPGFGHKASMADSGSNVMSEPTNSVASTCCACAEKVCDAIVPAPYYEELLGEEDGATLLHNVLEQEEGTMEALLSSLENYWLAVLLSTVLIILSTWYLRRRNRNVCWSDGDKWAAPGEWVRPFTNVEHMTACGHLTNILDTAQILFLKSEQPIPYALVDQALAILAERVLVLQLGIAWRGIWPWYYRLKTFIVPLTQSSKEPLDVYREQMNQGYNKKKEPLWRATLVQQPSTSPGTHEAVLVFTIHHAITDGTTNMILSRDLLTIINALTTGQDHQTPIRSFSPPLSDSIASHIGFLKGIFYIFFVIRKSVFKLFSGGAASLLPRATDLQPLTYALLHDFSQESTGQLVRRCKESGVRMHSCFLAACGLAFLRTAQKNKKNLKSTEIIHESPVNLRRFYPACHQEATGTVSLHFLLKHQMSDDQDFWTMAKNIQDDFYAEIEQNEMPLPMTRVGWVFGIIFIVNKILFYIGLPPLTYCHILLSNMGDLRKLLPTTYNGPVQLTRMLRSFSAHFMGSCFGVITQTFGGRLLLSIDYYNTKTTEETAKDFMDNLTKILYDIASHGTPMKVCTALESRQILDQKNDQVTTLSNEYNGHTSDISNGNITAKSSIGNGLIPNISNGYFPNLNNDQIPVINNGHVPAEKTLTDNESNQILNKSIEPNPEDHNKQDRTHTHPIEEAQVSNPDLVLNFDNTKVPPLANTHAKQPAPTLIGNMDTNQAKVHKSMPNVRTL